MNIPNKPGFIYFGTDAENCNFGVPYPTVPLSFATSQKIVSQECADGSMVAQIVGRRRSAMSFGWNKMTAQQWWTINEYIAANGPDVFCRYFDYNFGIWRVRRIIVADPRCTPHRPAGENSPSHGVPLYLEACSFAVTDLGEITHYAVTNTLTHVNNSNPATDAAEGSTYTATLTAQSGYAIVSVVITMSGADVTAEAYSDGAITIGNVTGAITITAVASEQASSPRISRTGSILTIEDTVGDLGSALYTIYFDGAVRDHITATDVSTEYDLTTVDPVEARTYIVTVTAKVPDKLPSVPSNAVEYTPSQLSAPTATLTGALLTISAADNATSIDLYADGEYVGNYPMEV